ncbi:hypothetical protein [Nocardioides psychrotolerans]|uniref:hypothetical protein n=1 Tax=Nocardioides psychrotolerans TaxID=1005945 RepID=UPI00313803F8
MPRVVPALLSVVILGILGMHVLSQHCATLTDEPASASHSSMAHGEHAGEPVAAAATVVAVVTGGAHDPAHLGLMLCAFIVLASAIALLLVALRARSHLPSYDVGRARSLVPRLRASPSGTGPPPVWQFSVIRC